MRATTHPRFGSARGLAGLGRWYRRAAQLGLLAGWVSCGLAGCMSSGLIGCRGQPDSAADNRKTPTLTPEPLAWPSGVTTAFPTVGAMSAQEPLLSEVHSVYQVPVLRLVDLDGDAVEDVITLCSKEGDSDSYSLCGVHGAGLSLAWRVGEHPLKPSQVIPYRLDLSFDVAAGRLVYVDEKELLHLIDPRSGDILKIKQLPNKASATCVQPDGKAAWLWFRKGGALSLSLPSLDERPGRRPPGCYPRPVMEACYPPPREPPPQLSAADRAALDCASLPKPPNEADARSIDIMQLRDTMLFAAWRGDMALQLSAHPFKDGRVGPARWRWPTEFPWPPAEWGGMHYTFAGGGRVATRWGGTLHVFDVQTGKEQWSKHVSHCQIAFLSEKRLYLSCPYRFHILDAKSSTLLGKL